MSAGDASTLRQVSLAAVIGLDARALLATDDPAMHEVYDRLIEQTRRRYIDTRALEARNQAAHVINGLLETFFKKRGG